MMRYVVTQNIFPLQDDDRIIVWRPPWRTHAFVAIVSHSRVRPFSLQSWTSINTQLPVAFPYLPCL